MTISEPNSSIGVLPLRVEVLLEEAQRQAGLDNFGSGYFLEALRHYVHALNTEANLSAAGAAYKAESIVRPLVNRLRMIEAIRLHPEIVEEDLRVLTTIVGLPRTGSTLFQRILTSIPGINGVRWWELQNFAPFPGEVPGQPVGRVQFAEQRVKEWLELTPEFAKIHPVSATQVDEEGILLHAVFSGVLEYGNTIPSYVDWQSTTDFREAYADLRTILKFLQWQEPSRRGRPWVLKAPEHMIAADALLATFPENRIVMTHRNPVQVIPSICSMHYSIQRLSVAEPDRLKIGAANRKRWGPALEKLTALRERIGDDRFIDINYREVLEDPVGEAQKVLAALGITLDAHGHAAVTTWLEENSRDQRGSHQYSAAEYGFTERDLENDFANYIRRFIKQKE